MPMIDFRCEAGHEFEALVKMDTEETPCRGEDCALVAKALPSYGRSLEHLKGMVGNYANVNSVRFNFNWMED